MFLLLSKAGFGRAGEEGIYAGREATANGGEFGVDSGDRGLLRPGGGERVSWGWRMRQNGYGRIWTNGICGEGGGVVFEQSAGMNELEVGSGEMDEVGDAGTEDSEGRVGRRGIEDEPRIVSFGRATLERKVYFSRASLMTSGILNLPLLTMSAEPEPEHPVRQQRSLRPVATLIASRSAAPPIPASLQAKLLAVRFSARPPPTLLTLHSWPPGARLQLPQPRLPPSMILLPPFRPLPSPPILSRTPSPFPRALRPHAYPPLSAADASGPASPSRTSRPAVPLALVPAVQKVQG